MLVDLFDFDGVLVDSLASHVQFYQDMAREFGFELPRERMMEAIRGPKTRFYHNLGFRKEDFGKVDEAYERGFVNYPCPVFPGIIEMLNVLKQQKRVLCLATSNRKHIVEHFFPYLNFFNHIKTGDNGLWKINFIKEIKEAYRDNNPLFIGDTRWDLEDAGESGIHFLGVSYGRWYDFSRLGKLDFRVVSSVPELREVLLSRS